MATGWLTCLPARPVAVWNVVSRLRNTWNRKTVSIISSLSALRMSPSRT
jgi:hypothetical protein